MSGVFIQGIIDNIKNDSTPYTPIIEAITNSIDSIEKLGSKNRKIDIYLERAKTTLPLPDDTLQDVTSIVIKDNGVGFTEENRNSFDTLYSPQKKDIGGKGFGRFFYLKHFSQVHINSTYRDDNGAARQRSFDFGRQFEVFLNERDEESKNSETGTELILKHIQLGKYDKDPEIFAHRVLEKLLSYFVDETYQCPIITLHDDELAKPLVLNELIGDDSNSRIQLKKEATFEINSETFNYKMFKLLHPRNQKSRIFLTARNQAVSDTPLDDYIPEFSSDFFENYNSGDETKERNYIVRFYIQGKYLDNNVTAERDHFNFGIEKDRLYPVSQKEIELQTASIAKDEFSETVNLRFKKKKQKIQTYAEQKVWYRAYLDDIDYTKVRTNLSEAEIEALLHETKFKKDVEIKNRIQKITSEQQYNEAHEAADKLLQEAKQSCQPLTSCNTRSKLSPLVLSRAA